jgi:hypothetical protein
VTGDVPQYVQKLQEKLAGLRALQGEANEVQAWLETTKELLLAQTWPPNSPTSPDENDSIICDPQVRQVMLPYISAYKVFLFISHTP